MPWSYSAISAKQRALPCPICGFCICILTSIRSDAVPPDYVCGSCGEDTGLAQFDARLFITFGDQTGELQVQIANDQAVR
jgi:hypothetical protein